jgi:hypothetical protein
MIASRNRLGALSVAESEAHFFKGKQGDVSRQLRAKLTTTARTEKLILSEEAALSFLVRPPAGRQAGVGADEPPRSQRIPLRFLP